MKFLILGFAQSGKDTFADYVVKKYSLKFKSASMLMAEKIIMPKFPDRYASVEECYTDRVNYRSVWARLLEEYVEDDKTKFMKEVFNESEIYCGLRSPSELIAAKNENLFDLSIWIDRNMCFEDKTSCRLTKHCCVLTDETQPLGSVAKVDKPRAETRIKIFACRRLQ